MNHDEFIAKLKELLCYADWHHRYYTQRARKYKRIDYWIRTLLGLIAVVGASMAGSDHFRVVGAFLAGGCAFALASVLPNFRWDAIVSGLKEEQDERTRIFQGYDDILNMTKILDRDEMLLQEFQKVEELKKSAELNDRNLPEDQHLLDKLEAEVRQYYKLDGE
ncbi:MAG: hypothetical protein ABSH48_15650 [Verrucomicrobiota bacterium]|jgi:hypothetical protein